jgi:two-component system, chemotaxis family, protein-glutamate methylesterase/glutaminase
MPQPYRLLIVDDSPMIRESIREIAIANGRFEVVGEAENGGQALRMVAELAPDLISLDIVMPGMNGISALKYLMINFPTPTVMVSSLTQEGAEETFDALRYGAASFIPKPSKLDDKREIGKIAEEIHTKFTWAAQVRIEALRYIRVRRNGVPQGGGVPAQRVVALGAHEGGYSALMKIIPHLRADLPVSYVVVLYEHDAYVDAFVQYLQDYAMLEVRRAMDGAPLLAGTCHIAAGEDYVTTRHHQAGHHQNGLALHVHRAPFESQKGSINRLFYSLAETIGERATGVVLSGSGDDGAEGMEELLRVGGTGVVQEPTSCLVREMPEQTLARCAVSHRVTDQRLAEWLNGLA